MLVCQMNLSLYFVDSILIADGYLKDAPMHHHSSLVSDFYRDVLAVILKNSRKQIISIFSTRKAD